MSSGDRGPNGGILARVEDNERVLEMKDGFRKYSLGGRKAQRMLQSQRKAVGREDGLVKHNDGGRRVPRAKETEGGSEI